MCFGSKTEQNFTDEEDEDVSLKHKESVQFNEKDLERPLRKELPQAEEALQTLFIKINPLLFKLK